MVLTHVCAYTGSQVRTFGAMRKQRPHYTVSLMLCVIQLMTTSSPQKAPRATALSFCQLLILSSLLCWKTIKPQSESWSQVGRQPLGMPIRPNVSTWDGYPNSSEGSTMFLPTLALPYKPLTSLLNPLPMPVGGGTPSGCSAMGSSNPAQCQQRRLPPRSWNVLR